MNIPSSLGIFGFVVYIVDLILTLFSISLNILVAHILVRRLGLTRIDTIISFILCIIDFFCSVYSTISVIIIWSTNYLAFESSNAYCQFNGSYIIATVSCTVDTVMILGILRCLAICYNKVYSIKMWVAINFLCIFINAAISIASFSLSAFTPYPSLKYCGFKPNDSIAHIFWYTAGIKEGVCVIVIVICYLRIAYHYHNYLSEIGNGSAKFAGQFDPKQNVEEAKQATNSRLILDYNIVEHSVKSSIKRVYIIVAIYVIEFMIIIGVQTTYKMLGTLPNIIIDVMLSLVTNLIPITNSLFILFFHDETNQELRNLLARRGR